MSIKVRNVSKQYGKKTVLKNLSFEVNFGEVTGFLGPNGAGKSSMMKIITSYIPPSSGVVEINGLNLEKHSLEIRKQIGYLPEHNPLYLEMYVKEYLEYVASIYKLGRKTKKRISEMIDLTGIGSEQNKKIHALSKGYRQRLGIAQALLHDPKVVIFDEPTTGLDPNQLMEIRHLIREIGKHKTVMLSTHIMQEVEACCKRALIIHKGSLVADREVEAIKAESSFCSIELEFSNEINLDLLETHQAIQSIKKEKNVFRYILNCSMDIRKEIFNIAASKGWVILEMKLRKQNLEDLFHELTTKP